jgi:hypothetical protein
LGHVDAVLRLYGESKPEAIRPKRVTQRNSWFSPRECARLVYDTLRPAEQPVTTREVVESIIVSKGLDPADVRTREMIQKTVLATINRLDGAEHIDIGAGAAVLRARLENQG